MIGYCQSGYSNRTYTCLYECLFVHLLVCQFVCLFACLSFYLFVCCVSCCLSVCLFCLFCVCVRACVRACVRVCMCLCMCLSVCICMSHLGLCCRHQNFVYVVCVFQFVFLWLAVAYSHLTSGNATIKHKRLAFEDNLQNIQIIDIHHC